MNRQFSKDVIPSARRLAAQAAKDQPRSYIVTPSRVTAGMIVAHCAGQWGNLPFPSVDAAEAHCRDDAAGRAHVIRREGGL